MDGVLYTPDGAVIPPSDQVQLLADVDQRLSLKWHDGLRCFVVALTWAPDDERRRIDRWAVETGHDWSIECIVPPTVRLDEMASWAMRQMARGGSEGARMVGEYHRRVEQANKARQREIGDAVRDDVLSTVQVDAPTVNVGKRRTRVSPKDAA